MLLLVVVVVVVVALVLVLVLVVLVVVLNIFHFQCSVIQNKAVVSFQLSVSVSKVLVIQDLAFLWIGLLR